MKDISLTDFVDFLAKAGSPRLTKAKELLERGKYDPATDFWRAFRDALKMHHKKNAEKKELDNLLRLTNEPNRLKKYSLAIQEYKKFLGRKKIKWFQPPRTNWSHSGLMVRINPELGLIWDDCRYIVKLYFNNEKMTKRKADLVNTLMVEALNGQLQKNDQVGVLDICCNKFYTGYSPNLAPLLFGEAVSLVAIWDELEKS